MIDREVDIRLKFDEAGNITKESMDEVRSIVEQCADDITGRFLAKVGKAKLRPGDQLNYVGIISINLIG